MIWLTFALALATAVCMKMIEDRHESSPEQKEKARVSNWRSIQEGWTLIWKQPSIRAIHVIYVLETMAGVIWIAATIYVYVADVRKGKRHGGDISTQAFPGTYAGRTVWHERRRADRPQHPQVRHLLFLRHQYHDVRF